MIYVNTLKQQNIFNLTEKNSLSILSTDWKKDANGYYYNIVSINEYIKSVYILLNNIGDGSDTDLELSSLCYHKKISVKSITNDVTNSNITITINEKNTPPTKDISVTYLTFYGLYIEGNNNFFINLIPCEDRPNINDITLAAATWANGAYAIPTTTIKAKIDTLVYVSPTDTITKEQYDAMSEARVVPTVGSDGAITLKAIGTPPSIDIPIKLTIVG